MKSIFSLLFLALFSGALNGQQAEPLFLVGANYSFVYTNNSNNAFGGNVKKVPFPGASIGVGARFNYSEKKYLQAFVAYDWRNIKVKDPFTLTDNNGNPIRDIKREFISNSYLTVGIIHLWKLSEKVSLGAGVNNHFLLFSKTYIPEMDGMVVNNNGEESNGMFTNRYFKTYTLGIPLACNIDFGKTFLWFLYDKGIMNRVLPGTGYKEVEDSFQVGVGFRFKGKKKGDS